MTTETPTERIAERYKIDRVDKPVTVYFGDDIIATSGHALVLREEGAEPVFYLPRDRVESAFLVDSDRRADSNDKGEARFFTISAMNRAAEDAAWCYDNPAGGLRPIAGHIAFDPTKLRVEVSEPPAGAMKETL